MTDLIDDLHVYYSLEEDAANTDVADAHGDNDGTASTNTSNLSAVGKVADGFDFTAASNEYVDFGNIALLGDAAGGAISFWFKWDGGNSQTILSKWGTGDRIGFFMDAGGSLQAWVGDSSAGGWHDLIASPSTGTWYHVVMNHKASDNTNQFYVNNDLKHSEVYDYSDENFDFRAGSFPDGSGDYDGMIDEIAVWHRELSADEIERLYNSGDGLSYSGLTDVTVEPTALALTMSQGSEDTIVQTNPSDFATSLSLKAPKVIGDLVPQPDATLGKGTRIISKNWPHVSGIMGRYSKQEGRVMNLVPQSSKVLRKNRKGL